MAETITIAAERRERAGKGMARETRRNGRIPAVLYGNNQEPVILAIETKGLEFLSRKPGFFTKLVDIKVGNDTHKALPRDAQRDPLSEALVHVDFLRVDEKTTIRVEVPVKFLNSDKAPGIKRGGVLNVVRHTLYLLCPATKIPSNVEIDLTGMEINDSIHIKNVKLPEGLAPVDKTNFTVASIAAPSAIRSEIMEKKEAEAAAAAAAAVAVEAAPVATGAPATPGSVPAAAPAAGAAAPAADAKAAPAAKK